MEIDIVLLNRRVAPKSLGRPQGGELAVAHRFGDRGILVTEGVRGEGGILLNNQGCRFMFDDMPDNYKNQTAPDEEEAWRYGIGDKITRRPPELLTRHHVARCINREVKAGRGSPHGGVYLDIAWIKKRIANSEEHIKK